VTARCSCKDAGDGVGGLVNGIGRHIQVRDGATGLRIDGIQQHAFLSKGRDEGRCRESWVVHVEEQNVRFHCGRVDGDRSNLVQSGRQSCGMCVIVRQPRDVVLQCVESCSRQNA